MSYIGYPLVGDPLYGPRKLRYGDKQYLHAKELSFKETQTSAKYLKIKAEVIKALPEWHSGAGRPGFLFVDEIIVK